MLEHRNASRIRNHQRRNPRSDDNFVYFKLVDMRSHLQAQE